MKNKMALVSLALVAFSTVSTINTKPAQAFGWWVTEELGIAGTEDNGNYWRSIGKNPLSSPPWDRNALCRWKTGRSDAKGEARSWFGSGNWQTRCYRTYWKWWR
jgi:hypothetical protein